MKTLELPLHTLILLVGPSGCGKSYLSRIVKTQAEVQLGLKVMPNVQVLSSDELRRDILGQNYHKHHPKMMHASKTAFNLLHTKIDSLVRHPSLAHYIIVDTTGLSKRFRDKILKQCKESNYNIACVIFDYESEEEYHKFNDSDKNFKKEITIAHIKKMKDSFWDDFSEKDFKKVFKIKSKEEIDRTRLKIENLDLYLESNLSNDFIYDVIGDVHGCYEEFVSLLKKLGYVISESGIITHSKDCNRKIISLGDLIDKGPDSKKVLKLVMDNLDIFILVKGNHENFVAKWHKGLLKKINMDEEFRKDVFDMSFEEDEEFTSLIREYDEVALPFVQNDYFIITHGPSKQKYLEKLDRKSIKNQMKGRQGRESLSGKSSYEEHYAYLKEESERSYPYHVFGHVSVRDVLKVSNKIGIDTGCVQGGRLTAITFDKDKITYTQVEAEKEYRGTSESLFNMFD